jgi:nitrate/nitrite transporter NarK
VIATKIAVVLGVVLLGVACWMAVIGVRAAAEGLLTVFALVLLVAGGNYMAGRTTATRRGPAASQGAAAARPSGAPSAPDPPERAATEEP